MGMEMFKIIAEELSNDNAGLVDVLVTVIFELITNEKILKLLIQKMQKKKNKKVMKTFRSISKISSKRSFWEIGTLNASCVP